MTSPPPRLLVEIDGRAVCARVRGRDPAIAPTPPVVLLAGGAGAGVDDVWGPELEDRLARETAVLTYDRAGTGRSDGPQHGSLAGMAEDLDQLLPAVGLDPPVVLVGWSLGGLVAQAYALRRPDHVAGLVFVDPTPSEPPPPSAAVHVQLTTVRVLLPLFARLSSTGALSGRMGERMAAAMAGPDANATTTSVALELMRSPEALRALGVAMARQSRWAAEIEDALVARGLPDVPAVVISALRRQGVPPEYVAAIASSHRRLAARFPHGRLVEAEHASHQVPYDDPSIIVEAVRTVLAEIDVGGLP